MLKIWMNPLRTAEENLEIADGEIERLRNEHAELLAAIENLIRVKGRHHTEIAYKRLVSTMTA